MKEIAIIIDDFEQGYLSPKDRQYIIEKMKGSGLTIEKAVICLILKTRRGQK